MQLYFIRHGKPKVLNNDLSQAHLSDEGLAQAKQLALSRALPRPDLVFSSPYNRAIDTARALCEVFEIGFEVEDFLGEWNLQSLNLLDPEYSVETRKGWADMSLRVLGGESLDDVMRRSFAGTMRVASALAAETVLFVSHGTLMEILCAKVGGRPALQSNVESMRFLEHVAFEFGDRTLTLTKDIARL